MKSSTTISEIAKALSKAQGILENPSKSASGYGYKYAKLDEIINCIREPLEANSLAIIHTMDWSAEPKLTTTLIHASGEWLSCDCRLAYRASEKTNEMQAIGSAITYCRKYNIQCLLNLYAEDDDGQSSGGAKQPYDDVKFAPTKQSLPEKKPTLKAKLNEDQVKTINTMLAGREGDRERVLKWKSVYRIEEINAEDYEGVLNALKKVNNG